MSDGVKYWHWWLTLGDALAMETVLSNVPLDVKIEVSCSNVLKLYNSACRFMCVCLTPVVVIGNSY